MQSDLLVFTTGSNLDLLKESARAVMITVHSYESAWSDYVEVKLRKGIQFLVSQMWEHPYAMWVDGNDSLILQPEAEILARLHAAGDPVVIAGESNCWPDAHLAASYPHVPYPHYINAGGFIGPIGSVLRAMHVALQYAATGDDQRAWTAAYLDKALPDVQIDHSRRIFSCMGDGPVAESVDTCVRHYNGHVGGREEYWRKRSTS